MVAFVLLLLDGDLRRVHGDAGMGRARGRALRGARAARRGAAHRHRDSRAPGLPLVFVLVYLAFARWMAWMAEEQLTPGTVARLFVLSLVPIAIAYHLAHYFTYLLIQGQLLIRLASDPLGLGWNLLGTARYRPDIGLVGARAVWYTAASPSSSATSSRCGWPTSWRSASTGTGGPRSAASCRCSCSWWGTPW